MIIIIKLSFKSTPTCFIIQFRCTTVGRKIKGKWVLPSRQPNNTKASRFPPRSDRLDGQSASMVGATPNRASSFHNNPFYAKIPTHAEAQFEFLSPQKWKQLSEKK